MAQRYRAFVFTINNPCDADLVSVRALAEDARYVIYGNETGEMGTYHLQGYVYFHNKVTFNKVKLYLSRAHIEVAKGTPEQNFNYCSKQGDYVEFGRRPSQGRRGDLDAVRNLSKMEDICNVATNYQAIRMAEKRLVYSEPKRNFKPFVVWFFGATGTGKSRGVHDCYPDVFLPQSFKWWDGYDGHESVLIDDFRADYCKFHDLLTLIDRYPYRVEFKGGSRQLRAQVMCFTSPFHPSDVYKGRTDEDIQQLLRRIDRVVRVYTDYNGNEVHEFA